MSIEIYKKQDRASLYEAVQKGIPPAVVIRPHHLFCEKVQSAFKRWENPKKLAVDRTFQLHRGRLYDGDESGYYADVLGNTPGQFSRKVNILEDYYTKLKDVPDISIAHLDLQPDGICRSCVVGKHCMGTNFTSTTVPHSTVEIESWKLNEIRWKLLEKGYKPDQHFIRRPSEHIVYNYHGRALNDEQHVSSEVIVFDSMLVWVGALRDI